MNPVVLAKQLRNARKELG